MTLIYETREYYSIVSDNSQEDREPNSFMTHGVNLVVRDRIRAVLKQ